MINPVEDLIRVIQNFPAALLKYFDLGLNLIAIFLVWAGLLPGGGNLASLAGLGFAILSYMIAAAQGGPEKGSIYTDLSLLILAILLEVYEMTSKNLIARFAVPLITTYVCLKRMGLGDESDQVFNNVWNAIADSRLIGLAVGFLVLYLAFRLITGRF